MSSAVSRSLPAIDKRLVVPETRYEMHDGELVPIAAMVRAAKVDDVVARALVTKRNPVIETVRAEDRAAGRIEGELKGKLEGEINGRIKALLAILTVRGIDAGPAREQIGRECDPDRFDRWIVRASTATLAEVFDGA